MATLDVSGDESARSDREVRVSAFFASTCWLGAVVLVALVLVGALAFSRSGAAGFAAAVVGAVVCFSSAALAMWVTAASAGGASAINGSLLAILIRTGFPLLLGVVVLRASPPLAEAGLFGMIFVFYLLTLTAETVLAVRLVNLITHRPKAV